MKNALLIGALLLQDIPAAAQSANNYTQTNLDSNIPGTGFMDTEMVNTWGLVFTGGPRAGSLWYVASSGTGYYTAIYGNSGDWGTNFPVPAVNGSGSGSPAGGCDFNNDIYYGTLDGGIFNTATNKYVVNNAAEGAVYTACTAWFSARYDETLYAANSAGGVEAYDPDFNPVTLAPGAFVDPNIPAGFTPYGIYATYQQIWVSFFNGTPGSSQGYVDAFDHNGRLLISLQAGEWMNQPFGIAQAPAKFGAFSNDLLVAMTGSGMIAAFNLQTGAFHGVLENASGQPIVISGIHGIGFGNGAEAGPTTTLYFAAGPDGFTEGLFGSITAN